MSSSKIKRKQRVVVEEEKDLTDLLSPKKKQSKKNACNSSYDWIHSENDEQVSNTDFGEVVIKAGFILKAGNTANILSCDQAIFKKNLKKALLLKIACEDNFVDKFIKSFEDYIQDKIKLKWCLLYSVTSEGHSSNRSAHSSNRGAEQDSLIRLFLNNDELQTNVINLLIEVFLLISHDESEENLDIPRLILANIRWLDRVVDAQSLAEKVIDLLHGSPVEIQRDVINFAPSILNDEHHPQFAKQLIELYSTAPELTPSILESLSYLSLDTEVMTDLNLSVCQKLSSVKPQHAPVIIKFLLDSTTSSSAAQVTSDIRENLRLPCDKKTGSLTSLSTSQLSKSQKSGNEIAELSDYEILLFSKIKMAVLVRKYLANAWISNIDQVKEGANIKPFDLLILFQFHQIFTNKRKPIESIFRNVVRLGLPVQSILSKTFAKHSAVLTEYFQSVQKISEQLMRSLDPSICDFAANLYKYSFIHMESFQQQDVLNSILSHLGDNANVRIKALTLLSQLSREHTNIMAKYTLFLRSSLDFLEILNLRESKLLMDSLIHLAYAGSEDSALRHELSILVHKQLSHTNIRFKRLGVLNAVLTLKNSVCSEPDSQNNSDSDTVIDGGFSDERLKEAEELFYLVRDTTENTPIANALFMDELGTTILKHGLKSKLEKWISHKLTNDFEATFVHDTDSSDCWKGTQNVPVSNQWNLDEENTDSESSGITVSIAEFVAKEKKIKSLPQRISGKKDSEILKMCPHFRLMRMVESHLHNGDLANIDALLGAGLQMPDPEVYTKFSTLHLHEKDLVLTCLFYAVNWLRELVNAFATQKDADLKKRVVLRFKKILKLQELLSQLLPLSPDYVPPTTLFDFDVSHFTKPTNVGTSTTTKKGSKLATKKKTSKDDSCLVSQAIKSQPSQKQNKNEHKDTPEFVDIEKYKHYFRELHLDVFLLLFKSLSLDQELEEENCKFLSLEEAMFLINDLNKKLSRIFGPSKRKTFLGKSNDDIGYSHFDIFSAAEVAELAVKFVKPVCAHLEKIHQFFQELKEENDGIEDSLSIYTSHTFRVSQLYSNLLTTLTTFLGWSNLKNPDSKILFSILMLFGRRMQESSSGVSQMNKNELFNLSARYLINFSESIVYVQTAAQFLDLLDHFMEFLNKDAEARGKMSEICLNFLKKEWYTVDCVRDKGSAYNSSIRFILKMYLNYSTDPIADIMNITKNGIEALTKKSAKDVGSEVFPVVKRSTLPLFYSVLLENLTSGTRKSLSEVNKNAYGEKLRIWSRSIKSLHALIEPVKVFNIVAIFKLCLQHCHHYLKNFLQMGMPLMDKCLQTRHADVIAVLKNLQGSTRFLHNLCNHAKVNQDSALVTYVPPMKRELETWLYKVKAMLAKNDCQDAFWIGNLKNKDIHGEEILTQAPVSEGSSGHSEEGDEENDDNNLSDVQLDDEQTNEHEETEY